MEISYVDMQHSSCDLTPHNEMRVHGYVKAVIEKSADVFFFIEYRQAKEDMCFNHSVNSQI